MPTTVKDKYEMSYWLSEKGNDLSWRYKKIIEFFDIRWCESIIDIGCGPLMGILPYVDSPKKTGVDPLMDEYEKEGLRVQGITGINSKLEDIKTRRKYETTVCINAIDHGDLDFSYIPKLMSFTTGKLYLLCHLRTPEQLNEGHDHSLTIDDFLKFTEKYCIKYSLHDSDPIDGANYQTLTATIQ